MRSRLLARRLVGFGLLAALGAAAPTAQAQTKPATRPTAPAKPFGNLPANPTPGDLLLDAYFKDRTAALAADSLADVKTAEDWNARKGDYRTQLAEMLGLSPMPPRTDLKPVVTGTVEADAFTVEKLHFQSMPGLYVTGNLYVPKDLKGKKAPAILYVCGHSNVKDPKTGAPLGNKAGYQHHGSWFARNGYVCLVIDTIQLGEIAGVHHGLFRQNMWWWVSRGYTPAGVEAWNSIRAIDYLQSRPEVDGDRIGLTGRSGGGAYTWWTAALDERVKVAVPVAGMTDLQNQVVDGVVEGHCDCMFHVNTRRWDFAQVAALVAPRPMLISNTDKDYIFPLDGVVRLHDRVRKVYRLLGADDKLGLLITEGPHKDTQDLQVPALRWFNRFLKNETGPVPNAAAKEFEPAQLKVFVDKLPGDELVTTIQDTFVPKAPPPAVPADKAAWDEQRISWVAGLYAETFAAWKKLPKPPAPKALFSTSANGIELHGYEVQTQPNVPVRIYVAHGAQAKQPEILVLNVVDEADWGKSMALYQPDFPEQLKDLKLPAADEAERESTLRMLKNTKWAMAYVAVRGVGPTAWTGGEKRETNIRRRFLLLGESLDGMRVWDVAQSAQAVRALEPFKGSKLWLQGERRTAGIALYAAIFIPEVARIDLHRLPTTHDKPTGTAPGEGPDLLNVLKVLDVPAAVAMVAEDAQVKIYRDANEPADAWAYPIAVARKLGWGENRVQVRTLPAMQPAAK